MSDLAKLITTLFYSSEPITNNTLIKNLGLKKEILLKLIDEGNSKLTDLGLVIISDNKTSQIVAKPEYTSLIEEFYDSTPQPLSQPALETLSVIAYKQPVTKDEIDEIRGISSDQSIKNLFNKHLIKKVNQNNTEKYITTTEFLKLMGIESIKELDNYEKNK